MAICMDKALQVKIGRKQRGLGGFALIVYLRASVQSALFAFDSFRQ